VVSLLRLEAGARVADPVVVVVPVWARGPAMSTRATSTGGVDGSVEQSAYAVTRSVVDVIPAEP
jgi:hypothetical protein